jgi:3-oxoacyl-[acyl-carrier protein] reductase
MTLVDVSNYSQIENTVSEITSKNKIDILINNAGNNRTNSTFVGI